VRLSVADSNAPEAGALEIEVTPEMIDAGDKRRTKTYAGTMSAADDAQPPNAAIPRLRIC
jgi:hypothetical protein